MADVFVSYSRRNRDRVAQISGGLEGGGYSLWWDKQLSASDDYGMLIEARDRRRALRGRRLVADGAAIALGARRGQ